MCTSKLNVIPIANLSFFLLTNIFSCLRKYDGCQLAVLDYQKPLLSIVFSKITDTWYRWVDVRLTDGHKICQIYFGALLHNQFHLMKKGLDDDDDDVCCHRICSE